MPPIKLTKNKWATWSTLQKQILENSSKNWSMRIPWVPVHFLYNIRSRANPISGKVIQLWSVVRPSSGMRICTHHVLDLSSRISNWCLKNVYDVIRLTFSSSSAETLHCEVYERKKRENNFQFSNTSMLTFSTHLEQEGFGFWDRWSIMTI